MASLKYSFSPNMTAPPSYYSEQHDDPSSSSASASASSSSSSSSSSSPSPMSQVQYTLNSKIMIAAIVVLFIVIVFVVGLHIYAKWFWRHTSLLGHHRRDGGSSSWRGSRRHRHRDVRLHFVEDHGPAAAAQFRSLGLDKAVVDSLPTFSYMPLKDVDDSRGDVGNRGGVDADNNSKHIIMVCDCAVCLCEFEENDKCRLLPACKHIFHIDCIDMWFHSHATCPLCRSPVLVTPNAAAKSSEDYPQLGSSSPLPLLAEFQHGRHGSEFDLADDHDNQQQQQHPHHHRGISFRSMVRSNSHTSHHASPNSSTTTPCSTRHGVSPSGRSLPHICIDIPTSSSSSTQPETVISTIPRCFSLSLSRLPSDQPEADDICGCSSAQPTKSSSFRVSIKRLLSIDRSKGRSRIFPSGQDYMAAGSSLSAAAGAASAVQDTSALNS